MEKTNYYEVLGVSNDATLEDIKKAYREKATENHPDSNPEANKEECHSKMCNINEAYSTLRNIDNRKEYDESLKEATEKEPMKEQTEATPEPQQENAPFTEHPKYEYKFYEENVTNNYEGKYENFNSVDFDQYQQEEFINWLETFYSSYMSYVKEYYKNENDLIKKLLLQFTSIIAIEKLLLQKQNNIIGIHK